MKPPRGPDDRNVPASFHRRRTRQRTLSRTPVNPQPPNPRRPPTHARPMITPPPPNLQTASERSYDRAQLGNPQRSSRASA
eukprot:5540236-Pyramimonas_sp.AAC.1